MAWGDQFSFVTTTPSVVTVTGELLDYTEGDADYRVIYMSVGGEGIDDRPIGPAEGKHWTFTIQSVAASFSAKKAAVKALRDIKNYKGSVTYNIGNKPAATETKMRLANINVVDEASNPLHYMIELEFIQVTR